MSASVSGTLIELAEGLEPEAAAPAAGPVEKPE
jgi:hypothetical protein